MLVNSAGTVATTTTPDEVAEAILYLASDRAAFSTGSSLVVDGGMSAG